MATGPRRSGALAVASIVLLGAVTFGANPAGATRAHWRVPVHFAGHVGGFNDIAAFSPTNRWAVGRLVAGSGRSSHLVPLIERWNGKRWYRFKTPPVPKEATAGSELKSVVIRAPSDVWVVGVAGDELDETDYVARWNGRRWIEHGLPQFMIVTHLAVFGPQSVWALGSNSDAQGAYSRWDGRRWRNGTLPAEPSLAGSMAAGWANASDPTTARPRLLHFDGARWRALRGPKVRLPKGTTSYWFNDVVDLGVHGLWVTVGYSFRDEQGPGLTLFHKTATGWKRGLYLADASPRMAVSDGRAGLWIYSSLRTSRLLHVVNGAVTRRVAPPRMGGLGMQIDRIASAPGHRWVFTVGSFRSDHDNDGTSAIARYRP